MYTRNSYELFLSLLLIIEVMNHPDVCSCPNAYHNRGGANATKRIKQKPNATTNKPMVNITNKVQHIILIHCIVSTSPTRHRPIMFSNLSF